MALLDFSLAEKEVPLILQERLQIIVAERRRSDARIIYRSYVKIFLRVICKCSTKSIRKWLPSEQAKDGDISISRQRNAAGSRRGQNKLFYGKIHG